MPSVKQETNFEQIQAKLKVLTEEISADLSHLESAQSKELLSDFVSELFLRAASQQQKEQRCQRQNQVVAAARARGVRFGRTKKPLPDNFDECYEAWQNGQITQIEAAEICGMSRSSFYREVKRIREKKPCST